MDIPLLRHGAVLLVLCGLLWGCAAGQVHVVEAPEQPAPVAVTTPPPARAKEQSHRMRAPDMAWKERALSQDELTGWNEIDPTLTPSECHKILARLNTKAHYYVSEDIRNGRALKVPNDFNAHRHWTPLPKYLPETGRLPKFILVVKDVPFLGWYNEGQLMGDTYVCVGKSGERTEAGLFTVLEKDANHFSASYSNDYGLPAWMPYSMRLYGSVWIHAGDITGPNCSHGCITLPLQEAEDLFNWADSGTVVLILDSLNDLHRDLKKYGNDLQTRR